MVKGVKRGVPQGEVHAGEGVDEKMKKLSDLLLEKEWSFKTEKHGVIDGARLAAMATEQEQDNKDDDKANKAWLAVHEPIMRRNGERGSAYATTLQMARAAAKGNANLLKILDGLKIRSGGAKKKEEEVKVG